MTKILIQIGSMILGAFFYIWLFSGCADPGIASRHQIAEHFMHPERGYPHNP